MSTELATLLASIGLVLLWFYLVLRLLQKSNLAKKNKGKEKGDGDGDEKGAGDGDKEEAGESEEAKEARQKAEKEQAERERKAREAAEAKARQAVIEALQKDPMLREKLEHMARLEDLPQLTEDQKAREIIKRVPAHVLQVLVVAGTQKDIEMDLDTVFKREQSLFPTNDVEPVPMNGLEQMSQVLPEQMMMEDDAFYPALVNDELMVLQPFERKVQRKTLHISLDLSGSMAEGVMSDGLTRHNWSRGITVSLLLKAVNGEAKYMLRGFAGKPYALDVVDTPEQAQELIDKLLETAATGDDTNIWGAINQAVKDVRAVKKPDEIADILVITDGVDNKGNKYGKAEMKALFGEDIRLHVVAIGLQAPVLQSGATSYREFK